MASMWCKEAEEDEDEEEAGNKDPPARFTAACSSLPPAEGWCSSWPTRVVVTASFFLSAGFGKMLVLSGARGEEEEKAPSSGLLQ